MKTCGACPEQYDAYIKEIPQVGDSRVPVQVGYLRVRHGYFRVDYPDCGGETIFEADIKGDGSFDFDEREEMLDKAKEAIIKKLRDVAIIKEEEELALSTSPDKQS